MIDERDEVFDCMKIAGLKCKSSKREIHRESRKYLPRMVDKQGVRTDPDAVEAVLTWKVPRTERRLMSLLRFAIYHWEFIKGYAVYPLQQLMRNKGKKFVWNERAQKAFQNIKRELCEAPVLGMPTDKGMYNTTLMLRWLTFREYWIRSNNGMGEQFSVPVHMAIRYWDKIQCAKSRIVWGNHVRGEVSRLL